MDNAQLTAKQKQFFDFILEYRKENGIWPTYREIADRFGFRSPNSVTQNLQSLLKKGYLVKGEDQEYELHPRYLKKRAVPLEPRVAEPETGIPVRGIIAAGSLQEAVEADMGTITLRHLFPNLDKLFALRVSGMSMKDTGIYDGDFVLLVDDDLKDGDIGAVMYNGETSLKRVYYGRNGLRLEPANDAYSHIRISPDVFEEVRVVGKYVGHVNRGGIYNRLRES